MKIEEDYDLSNTSNIEDCYLTTDHEILSWLQSMCVKAQNLRRELIDIAKPKFRLSAKENEKLTAFSNPTTGDKALNQISLALLACCHPSIVPTAYECIVAYEHIRVKAFQADEDSGISYLPEDTPLGKDTRESKLWVALKELLCSLAPISFHVAVRVVDSTMEKVMSSDDEDGMRNAVEAVQKAILLFGHWMPDIAPHLHSVVDDFFVSVPEGVWDALGKTYLPPSSAISKEDKDGDVNMIGEQNSSEHDSAVGDETALKRSIALAEATLHVCDYYAHKRGDVIRIQSWCKWNWVFDILSYQRDYQRRMWQTSLNQQERTVFQLEEASNIYDGFRYCFSWHSARAVAILLDLYPPERTEFLRSIDEAFGSEARFVSSLALPFWLRKMKEAACDVLENVGMAGVREVSDDRERRPDPLKLLSAVSLHPYLVHIGSGILQYVQGSVSPRYANLAEHESPRAVDTSTKRELVRTPTTEQNLERLGLALCMDPPTPILVCGPRGSGKSALVRELAQICCKSRSSQDARIGVSDIAHHLLELHMDDDTDSKTLLGTMVASDIPGKFEWKPGPLTLAVQHGRWVLMEDVDKAPAEILAALKPLLEERLLPYTATRKRMKAHPNFRFFGTYSTIMRESGKESPHRYQRRIHGPNRLLLSGLWRQVHVDPLPYQELSDIVRGRFPSLPPSVIESCLSTFRAFEELSSNKGRITRSGNDVFDGVERGGANKENAEAKEMDWSSLMDSKSVNISTLRIVVRPVSIRDFMKLCQRIASNISFEPSTTFATESQRTLCLAEAVDVFASATSCREARRIFVAHIVAPTWDVSKSLAVRYVETRKPEWKIKDSRIELGRATIPRADGILNEISGPRSAARFSDTSHSLRLMESIGICIALNEYVLQCFMP